MIEENGNSEITFNGVVKEIQRWSKIIVNTTTDILNSDKEKDHES